MLSAPNQSSSPGKLQNLVFAGFLGLGPTACRDTRSEIGQTITAERSGGPDQKAGSPDAPHPNLPSADEKVSVKRQKVFVAREDVSEGMKAMAEIAPGRSWLGRLQGNGGRDTMIYVPEGFDEKEAFELIYFFHGTGAHIVEPPTVDLSGENFGRYLRKYGQEPCVGTRALSQVLGSVEQSQEKGFNQVLVYPLSAGARGTKLREDGTRKPQDLRWMRPGNDSNDSMFILDDEAQAVIRNDLGIQAEVDKVTIKGHSAGGAPLGNILQSGFPADRVDYLDASYWPYDKPGLLGAYRKAMEVNPDMEINIFVHYLDGVTDIVSRKLCRGKRLPRGVVRINANGRDEAGRKILHGKMMRNYWDWQRGESNLLACP